MGCIWVLVFIFYMYPIKPANPQNPMGMGMGVSFQYPMGMGTGMDVIFENGYEWGYSSTRPEPAPLPFRYVGHGIVLVGHNSKSMEEL